MNLLYISAEEKIKQALFIRRKFSFTYVDISSDVPECNSFFEKYQYRILIVFPPIFVAKTKIMYGYNFVVPLTF